MTILSLLYKSKFCDVCGLHDARLSSLSDGLAVSEVLAKVEYEKAQA